ncbi:hypothetical protein Taro_036422 [Colocasia esculenta]|uniref:beta-glucosidase n=1 Tax=Colocasia esculenta TaxID=4460 RepID=A0A843W1J6_COLES|nr:hypothetical protein [Colocasia esculenta]
MPSHHTLLPSPKGRSKPWRESMGKCGECLPFFFLFFFFLFSVALGATATALLIRSMKKLQRRATRGRAFGTFSPANTLRPLGVRRFPMCPRLKIWSCPIDPTGTSAFTERCGDSMGHPECLVFFFFFVVAGAAAPAVAGEAKLSRSSFPPGFLFGTASAAYQYEGAAAEGGRGPSIWDTFTSQHPEKIKDRSSGSIATDFYHRYKEDVNIMKDLGVDAFRFSISWSRILPLMLVHVGADGSLRGGINKEGIAYYNNIIDELVSKGLHPFVTLFHWDSPQGLEDLYGGFLSPNIDFVDYSEVCFREFGDRVKHWITFNEPYSFCTGGYASGNFAPGRCSSRDAGTCSAGDSGREPYTVCHHQLLAHAAAVKLYRNKYKQSIN